MRRFVAAGAILLGLVLGASTSARAQTLRVGIDINGEPMTAVDSKGVPTGFAVEIMNAIAEEMHFQVIYVAKPWEDMFEDFKAGRLDALANITYTSQRALIIDYTDPHLVMEGAVFVRKGDRRLKTAADLRNLSVAIKPGGSPYSYLETHGWLGRVIPAPTLRDSLQVVANGAADATLDSRIIGTKNIHDDHLDNLEVANVVVPEFALRLHIGLHKNDSRLNTINDGLARLRTNGAYDRIHDKWVGPLQPHRVRLRDLQPYLLPALLLLAAIVSALAWQRRLLRRLARQAAELHQSKEQLTLVLEGSEDGFWDWDLQTGRIERSERWAAMLGYTLAEIEPTLEGGLKFVHPDDLALCREFRAPAQMRDAPRYDLEFRMRTKSGDWRWILNRGKIVASARDGTPRRVAGTHTDITNLKRAQQELARQETQFRFIYETAPVGLSWVRRREGDTRLVNPAHERITGVPVVKSRDSANYVEATHPDDRERQRQLSEQLYRGDIEQFSMEKRYVHPDDKIVWAMHTAHLYRDPVTHEPQEVTTLVDITELKRAEEEREKLRLKMLDSQKLESLGVLAGGIAHDFNNLLTVILANASIARSETDDASARAQHLSHVETAARRAADLCRQMLAYAGRGSFVIDRVDVGKLLRDTAQLLQVSISKKARLILEPATGVPPVEADISQLQQVVMNLVINASDALGDAPGEITLTTRLGRPHSSPGGVIHSFDLPEGQCVCLEVNDTGQGMTPATLARVFDPFFTTKFAGRGLGLAAVLGIVRTHHGALAVESRPGRGSRFSLFLPAAALVPETPSRNTRPPVVPRTVAGTILIADDEPVVLATTDHLLRRFGYQTVLAADGNEVVRQFRSNPNGFTAVLLDLTMPGLDGVEALREIRKLNPEVPVLLMSGYSEQDMLSRIRDQGPVPVLRKPFSHDVLLARLAEVIAG